MSVEIVGRSASAQPDKHSWQGSVASLKERPAAIALPARLLILCSRYSLPYRVLRCAAQGGAVVYAMGNRDSRSLRLSRYCQGFIETAHGVSGNLNVSLAADINAASERHGITMVLAAGHLAMRSLVLLRTRLKVPCFPMPAAQHFGLLNDKWSFYRHCLAQGVSCPESWLYSDVSELRTALEDRSLPLPLIVKPLDRDGGHGVCVLRQADWRDILARIDYAPLIAQQWIEGEDIGAAAYCRAGRIESFLLHRYHGGAYEARADSPTRQAVERILMPLGTDGVFNFDMRRDRAGKVHFLECNPRFFFKIGLAAEAGFNFVQFGLDPAATMPPTPERTVTVRRPAAALLHALTTAQLSWNDLAFAGRLWADPLPYIRETLRIDWDE